MNPSAVRLRSVWFQVHKWIGITLAILVIPIALSGAALVWHDWLDEQINPQRFPQVTAPLLEPGSYAAAATGREARRGGQSHQPSRREGRGPGNLDQALPDGRRQSFARSGSTRGLPSQSSGRAPAKEVLSVIHVLHGSLMVPGVGRKIVGLIGVAMLLSSLTGLWLWWPLKGSVRRGLHWKRRPDLNSNLHFQAGFWISLPLAVLSLTGVWISFPEVFSGTRSGPSGTAPRVLEQTHLSPDQTVAAA